ncbi:holo-ACP synthase [bacterium]|nr:holo-ACP synthase [bacterium]
MIIGHGIDSVDIRRIEQTLERFGERFVNRCFHTTEIAKAKRREPAGPRTVAATYAKRYAAKEAAAKALGTGLAKGVFWKDIEVQNLTGGQPILKLHRGAQTRLQAMLPAGSTPHLHLSLTDDYPYASASVIISAEK